MHPTQFEHVHCYCWTARAQQNFASLIRTNDACSVSPPNPAVLEAGGFVLSHLDGSDGVPIVVAEPFREGTLNALIPENLRALHAILDAID